MKYTEIHMRPGVRQRHIRLGHYYVVIGESIRGVGLYLGAVYQGGPEYATHGSKTSTTAPLKNTVAPRCLRYDMAVGRAAGSPSG